MESLFDRIDSLFGFRKYHRKFLTRSIPQNIGYSYCFGGLAFSFFLVLAATGLLLSLYYIPSEKEAYKSIVMITRDVAFGRVLRSVHKWSASFFIVFIFLHTIRVFISRAYRPPRDLNWIAGVLAFVAAMASGFTGYLLPWDQKAYWATEVGTSMIQTVPFFGTFLMHAVRGGPDVTGRTLIRFYSLHVLYLPLMTGVILWAHFHMVKRLGISKKL